MRRFEQLATFEVFEPLNDPFCQLFASKTLNHLIHNLFVLVHDGLIDDRVVFERLAKRRERIRIPRESSERGPLAPPRLTECRTDANRSFRIFKRSLKVERFRVSERTIAQQLAPFSGALTRQERVETLGVRLVRFL